jgi:signal transduction histidine kinase
LRSTPETYFYDWTGEAMNIDLSRLIARFDHLVNFFIPESIKQDREASKRAHVFLISHILGPFIGNVVPAAIFFFDPHPSFEVAVLALSITAFWLFPFLLRAGAPYNPLALVSIQNLIFCILWSCYFYGGVTSPTLPWVLTIPLLAFFYLGSSAKLRLIVIAMFAINLAIFVGLYQFGYPVKSPLPGAGMQGLGLVSTIAASIYVAMMALYYAKVLASQTELESEMRQHMATASELRLATLEAERAGSAKDEFLARMSHELRTPLNAVIGYSQMLLEEDEDPQSIADLNKIHGAGQHLLKLVNEILDLSKIEAGKMELYLEHTDISELLEKAVRDATPAAQANGNRIVGNFGPAARPALVDASKLRDLVGQLLDNAAKFTQNGTIEVSVEDAGEHHVTIHIADTGIGIAPDQIAGLFEKFTVVDDRSTSKYGGTGLGLALSQKLCKLMGGEIAVESALGQGSRFTIRIPRATGPAHGDDEFYDEATLAPAPHLRAELETAVASDA